MKNKALILIIILVMLLSMIPMSIASAGAYDTSFITSITYQNVDTSATTNLRVYFYDAPNDTTPIEIVRPSLNSLASTSLFIGSLGSITPGFRGTAVMASDKKMVATLVQLPQGSADVKNRPLSNGFSSGTTNSLLATVLTGGQVTVLSVQNAGTSASDVAIRFYNTSAVNVHTINVNLAPGAGYFVDASQVAQLGGAFSGSAVIESTGGSIVSSAMELGTGTSVTARAFEGVGSGSMTVYMPSAQCNYGTQPRVTNTNYAVQNTNLTGTSTTVNVTYSNGATQSAVIGSGAKASFNTCAATGMTQNWLGAATITSSTTPIIAVGKLAGDGQATAYVGFPGGASKIALPYVRWATQANYDAGTQQRVNIAIQNVGGATITGDILVKYIDRDGVVVGTHTITQDLAVGGKVNSNATNAGLSEFGVYPCGVSCVQFGGGAIVEGPVGSQLAVIARVASWVVARNERAGEDYNGIPIQ